MTTEAPTTAAVSPKLSVHILATTAEGTRRALMSAKRLTDGLGARIVLLVPRVTSLVVPFDPGGEERAVVVDEYRALAVSVGVHVSGLFCIARRLVDVIHSMVGPSSLVIVGGRRRVWWPSREQRLAMRLTAEGYAVVFAEVGAEHAQVGVHALAS